MVNEIPPRAWYTLAGKGLAARPVVDALRASGDGTMDAMWSALVQSSDINHTSTDALNASTTGRAASPRHPRPVAGDAVAKPVTSPTSEPSRYPERNFDPAASLTMALMFL